MNKDIEIVELAQVEHLELEVKTEKSKESSETCNKYNHELSKKYAAHRGNSAMLAAALSALLS